MIKVADKWRPKGPKLDISQFSQYELKDAPPGSAWYCLHTRSRREKCVATDCYRENIPFFLPLRKSIRRYNSHQVIFDIPLFPGYLFCAATRDQRYWLLTTNNLANMIEVPDQINNEDFPFGTSGTELVITDKAGAIGVLAEVLFWITKKLNYI